MPPGGEVLAVLIVDVVRAVEHAQILRPRAALLILPSASNVQR